MEIAIIIWLWVSCYVLGVTITAAEKDTLATKLGWRDHAFWFVFAPLYALPCAAFFAIRNILP